MNIDKDEEALSRARPKYLMAPTLGLICSSFFLIWLTITTNPSVGGPKLIIFFLSVVFLFTLCLFSITIQLILQFIGKNNGHSWHRLLYSSIIFAFGIVFLLGLQSLNQLRLIDVILVFLFEVVVNFYVLRRF